MEFKSVSELPPHLAQWGAHFVAAEVAYGVPSALLAAICDRESRGGDALYPKGPGGKGDHGHAHGLMQIDYRYHRSFLDAVFDDGTPLWKDPAFNVMYGAKLLARNAKALAFDWNGAIASYNCGLMRVQRVLAALLIGSSEEEKIAALDKVTTGGDYISDVRRRCFALTDPAGAV